jgi:hypothetical protein
MAIRCHYVLVVALNHLFGEGDELAVLHSTAIRKIKYNCLRNEATNSPIEPNTT